MREYIFLILKGGIKLTYNDLCAEILSLGFESETDSPERILSAAERALRVIFTECPLYETVSIYKNGISPVSNIPVIRHKGGETNSVKYKAKAYAFKTSGTGSYKVCEGEEESEFDFSGKMQLHRGFLHGDGEIKFLGDYSFSVFDFSLYDELYGPSPDDIPIPDEHTAYDILDYTDSFLCFKSLPSDEYGNVIQGSSVMESVVKIPSGYTGKITVTYKRAPQKLSGSPDEKIVLPRGCEHLLALLSASYVWLDDSPDMARYYRTLYQESLAAIRYNGRREIDPSYQNVNGWA